jgi:peptidoglycan/xylan/chitin deacetylase (PgdA/CDA1 family)
MRAAGAPTGALVIRLLRSTRRHAGVALMLHRVGDPPGDPERELVPSLGTGEFESQMRFAARHFRLVRASELQAAAAARRRGDPFPLAITFDDDLPSHVSSAAPLLSRLGAPATFFLNGASLERPHRFWWEALQLAQRRGIATDPPVPAPEDIHEVALSVQLMDPPRREELEARLAEALGPPSAGEVLGTDEVKQLAAAGFEVGFHTRWHPWLPSLTDAELVEAMRVGRAELEAAAGARLDTIAYPHGGAGEGVASAARDAGFRHGFTTRQAAVTPEDDPLLLGRVENSFRSTGHLAVRIARVLLAAG